MRTRRLITAILAVLAVTLTAMAIASLPPTATALAQPEPPDEDEGGSGPLRRPPEFSPPGPGMMRPFPAAGGGAALAVHGDNVYVLSGNTIYQFAAEDLKLLKKVTLQEEPPHGRPAGRRRGHGGPRPGGDRPRDHRPHGERP